MGNELTILKAARSNVRDWVRDAREIVVFIINLAHTLTIAAAHVGIPVPQWWLLRFDTSIADGLAFRKWQPRKTATTRQALLLTAVHHAVVQHVAVRPGWRRRSWWRRWRRSLDLAAHLRQLLDNPW